MDEIPGIAGRTAIGAVGFISSWKLNDVNEILSTVVAVLTIIFLSISICQKLRRRQK